MSQDFDDVIHEGPVKSRPKRLGFGLFWKSSWLVLCKASSRGPLRIEKYADEQAVSANVTQKTIFISDIVSVARLPANVKPCAFVIHLKNVEKQFACNQEREADQWVGVIESNRVTARGVTASSPHSGTTNSGHELFNIYLLPNPLLEHSGECLLEVAGDDVRLLELDGRRLLISWPLGCLRRYGCDATKFTFESGRSCITGEGTFILNTMEGQHIQRNIKQATERLVQQSR